MDLRASILCLALPFGRVLSSPDSTIDQAARQQVALCYTEILASAPVVAVAGYATITATSESATLTLSEDTATLSITRN